MKLIPRDSLGRQVLSEPRSPTRTPVQMHWPTLLLESGYFCLCFLYMWAGIYLAVGVLAIIFF